MDKILFLIITFTVFALDQLSKMLIVDKMYLGQSIPVIMDVFHITFIYNPGAAFGIMPDKAFMLILVGLLVVVGILFYYYRQKSRLWVFTCSLAFIVGGTLGNLLDRIRIGKVIDFIDFRIWPVFNLADTAIVLGAVLLTAVVMKMENQSGGD